MENLQILIKPVSAMCNLECQYCFYLEEAKHWEHSGFGTMSKETASILIQRTLKETKNCTFAFQGGEPTLAGLSFFRFFVEETEKNRRSDQQIFYTLQTNGTLLTEEWARFFRKWNFLLGVSMDGTRRIHDKNRKDGAGNGSFSNTFRGIRLLQKERVPFHILCVLTGDHAERMDRIYRFFYEKGFLEQQYIPCLEPLETEKGKMPYALTGGQYARILKTLFDLWYKDRISERPVYIRQFENYLSILLGGQPEACAMYGCCTMQNIVEADGSVYPCDFYVGEPYCIGNIRDMGFEELAVRAQSSLFFENAQKRDDRCPECRWYPLCRGGCRRDCRKDKSGTFRNDYCEAYQEFFAYAIGRLEELAARIDKRK